VLATLLNDIRFAESLEEREAIENEAAGWLEAHYALVIDVTRVCDTRQQIEDLCREIAAIVGAVPRR
jgi:hypothetical protein